jgi:hypothetical protein
LKTASVDRSSVTAIAVIAFLRASVGARAISFAAIWLPIVIPARSRQNFQLAAP